MSDITCAWTQTGKKPRETCISDMNKASIFILFVTLVFFACTERPTESDASEYFKQTNTKVDIISVRISEDEVACRTFEIIHRDKAGKVSKSYVLYFDDSKKPFWSVTKKK